MNEKLQEEVRKILARDDVRQVIGYTSGSRPGFTRAIFAKEEGDAGKFVFSPLCWQDLVVYLTLEEKLPLPRGVKPDDRKTGIVVKGCDSKAMVTLLQEKGIERDDVVIIGMPCDGQVDPNKLGWFLEDNGESFDDVESIELDGDKVVIGLKGKKIEASRMDVLFTKCLRCENPNPLVYDVLIGDEVEVKGHQDYSDVDAIESMSQEERHAFWRENFDRCIRCYACRNICPICYCKECVLVDLKRNYVPRSIDSDGNFLYHLNRALCMTGRCIDCGECERACPVNIPLVTLYRMMEKEVLEKYKYKPGTSLDAKPLLSTYDLEDEEEWIW